MLPLWSVCVRMSVLPSGRFVGLYHNCCEPNRDKFKVMMRYFPLTIPAVHLLCLVKSVFGQLCCCCFFLIIGSLIHWAQLCFFFFIFYRAPIYALYACYSNSCCFNIYILNCVAFKISKTHYYVVTDPKWNTNQLYECMTTPIWITVQNPTAIHILTLRRQLLWLYDKRTFCLPTNWLLL